MTKMMIKCKNCGFDFASQFQESEESFKAANAIDSTEACPKCTQVFKFNKSDFFFK